MKRTNFSYHKEKKENKCSVDFTEPVELINSIYTHLHLTLKFCICIIIPEKKICFIATFEKAFAFAIMKRTVRKLLLEMKESPAHRI